MKQKVGADLAAEAIHRRGVKGDPVCEGAFELAGHDGHIVLLSIDVAKGQPNKLDVPPPERTVSLLPAYTSRSHPLSVIPNEGVSTQIAPFLPGPPCENGGQSKRKWKIKPAFLRNILILRLEYEKILRFTSLQSAKNHHPGKSIFNKLTIDFSDRRMYICSVERHWRLRGSTSYDASVSFIFERKTHYDDCTRNFRKHGL